MKGFWSRDIVLFVMGLILGLAFIGCGGGGGGGGSTDDEIDDGVRTITVSGMAVSGAPVVGTVNIKDSTNPAKTSYSAINSDGSYSLNITSEWKSPFLLWVNGLANNQSVKMLSSFAIDDENEKIVNITPLTNTIVASAIGKNIADIDPETESIPDSATVEAIKDIVQEALEQVFAVFGLDTSFDLFETPIDELGSGSDQMFDVISFSTDGSSNIVVTSKEDDAITVSIDQSGDVTGDITQIANTAASSKVALEQIQEIMGFYFGLYETSRPDETTLTSQLKPYMAEGYLNSGYNRDDIINLWANDDKSGIIVGAESLVSCSIYRAMKSHTYGIRSINEIKDNYSKGLWVNVDFIFNGVRYNNWSTSFVKTGEGDWLWYGNRRPMRNGGRVRARGWKKLYSAGVTTCDTGLHIYTNDVGNLASDMGITNQAIFNPVMPAEEIDGENTNCLRMARKDDGFSTEYGITNVSSDFNQHLFRARVNGGLDLTELASQDTKEFVFIGLDDSDNPIGAWISLIGEAPLPVSELEVNDAEYFPVIIGPQSFTEIDFEGENSIQWQLPANGNLFASWSGFAWRDENGNYQEISINNPFWYEPGDLFSWTTDIFDPSSMAGIVQRAYISTELFEKANHRRYKTEKIFQPWVEEFVSISGGELVFDVEHAYAAENLSDRIDTAVKTRDVTVTRLEATVTIESASKVGDEVDVRTEIKLSYQPDEYYYESDNDKDYFEVKIRILYENDGKLHLGGGVWGSISEDGTVEYEIPNATGDFPFWEEIATTQSHTYAVEYDESSDSFKIEYDGYISTIDMSTFETFDPADFKEARIRTRISNVEMEGDQGQMKTHIDNVMINGQFYEDFTDGFTINKWDVNAYE